MYAEYTRNGSRMGRIPYKPSRVFRSRDFGQSWQLIREEPSIRHFHFLQVRPGSPGEWWLTSGDQDFESRIWKSVDDGDTWVDQTAKFGARVNLGTLRASRRLFRLTDLVWDGDDIIWGCDDPLFGAAEHANGKLTLLPGSRAFRGQSRYGDGA